MGRQKMRVVRTAMKNRPSKRGSRARRALRQVSRSNSTSLLTIAPPDWENQPFSDMDEGPVAVNSSGNGGTCSPAGVCAHWRYAVRSLTNLCDAPALTRAAGIIAPRSRARLELPPDTLGLRVYRQMCNHDGST